MRTLYRFWIVSCYCSDKRKSFSLILSNNKRIRNVIKVQHRVIIAFFSLIIVSCVSGSDTEVSEILIIVLNIELEIFFRFRYSRMINNKFSEI